MLPVQYRMRRSADFGATVRRGRRAVQPDLVVHARRAEASTEPGPHVGLIIAKSVGTAVQRHRVARQLRHVMRDLLGELADNEQLVIRVRAGSCRLTSAEWERQLRAALHSVHRVKAPVR